MRLKAKVKCCSREITLGPVELVVLLLLHKHGSFSSIYDMYRHIIKGRKDRVLAKSTFYTIVRKLMDEGLISNGEEIKLTKLGEYVVKEAVVQGAYDEILSKLEMLAELLRSLAPEEISQLAQQ